MYPAEGALRSHVPFHSISIRSKPRKRGVHRAKGGVASARPWRWRSRASAATRSLRLPPALGRGGRGRTSAREVLPVVCRGRLGGWTISITASASGEVTHSAQRTTRWRAIACAPLQSLPRDFRDHALAQLRQRGTLTVPELMNRANERSFPRASDAFRQPA